LYEAVNIWHGEEGMTQILGAVTSEGIIVATDSTATEFDPHGKERRFPVEKLFSVGSHAFIVSGGMGISVHLSLRFKRYVEEKGLPGIEPMIPAAGAFLNGQLGEALKACRLPAGEPGALERIYFLLGGYSFRSGETPYQLALWASETGRVPLKRIQIGAGVAIPRSLAAEVRLNRMAMEKRPLGEILDFAHQFLTKLAASGPDVGPPFNFGVVTSGGFKLVEPSLTPERC
jgi:hypothetical protein